MALRLNTVRLLVADDVGVGKTIEALLVARELLDRGEIKRLYILCPPYLCDQWQRELQQKANLEAVVIRSGTVGQLDRRKTGTESVYRHYPIQIVSIDFVKSDRNRHLFLMDCPEFVIVDEAHGATQTAGATAGRQQRHRLVQDLAAKQDRHLVLLTATPHSGFESSFRSLLALLQPEFGGWDTSALSEPQLFAQRTLRPAEVRAELEATDAVLGDPDGVRDFVLEAAQRLNLTIGRDRDDDVFRVPVGQSVTAALPEPVRFALPASKTDYWRISFVSPTPVGAEYLGRITPSSPHSHGSSWRRR